MSADAFAHVAHHGDKLSGWRRSRSPRECARFSAHDHHRRRDLQAWRSAPTNHPRLRRLAPDFWVFLCLGLRDVLLRHSLPRGRDLERGGAADRGRLRGSSCRWRCSFHSRGRGHPASLHLVQPGRDAGSGEKLIAKEATSPRISSSHEPLLLGLWSFFSWYFVRNSTRRTRPAIRAHGRISSSRGVHRDVRASRSRWRPSTCSCRSSRPWYSTIFGVYAWAGLWQAGLGRSPSWL